MSDGVSQAALSGLAWKYREMKRLREDDASGTPGDPKPRMRALAAGFPGALREIDALPMELIDARLTELEGALSGGRPEPWMRALSRYHAWMRLALALRLACVGSRTLESARTWLHSRTSPLDRTPPLDDDVDPRRLDEPMLASMLRPPHGRLNALILATVARELGTESAIVESYLTGGEPAPGAQSPGASTCGPPLRLVR